MNLYKRFKQLNGKLLSGVLPKIPFLFFLILFVGCLFVGISRDLEDHFLREKEIKISVDSNSNNVPYEIYILNQGIGCEIFNNGCIGQMEKQGWKFLRVEDGLSCDMLVKGVVGGEEYVVTLKEKPTQSLVFLAHANGGAITVRTDEWEKYVDLFDIENEDGSIKVIYPFEDSSSSFLLKAGFFLVLFCIVSRLSYLVILCCKKLADKTICGFSNAKAVIILSILFWIIDIYLYYSHKIPHFLEFGDQIDYWTGIWDASDASLLEATKSIRVWNGYLCFYIVYFCRVIGRLLSIDPCLLWFAFTSVSAASICGYSLPQLFFWISGESPVLFSVIVFVIIYSFFWLGTLSAVLMDLIGVSAFLLAIVFLLHAFNLDKKRSFIYAMGSGALFSVAVSFRSVYFYATVCMLFVITISNLFKYFSENVYVKKILIRLLCLFVCFFIVSIPQAVINRYIGASGFLPCANREIWNRGKYERSIGEYSVDATMSGAFTGYPYYCSDEFANTIKENKYSSDSMLTISQALDLFISRPTDTVAYVVKKIFIGFDVKTSISYPYSLEEYPNISEVKGVFFYVFSFLNYFVIGSALYIFVKHLKNRERMLILIPFFSVILPHTWTHVEWRYYLIGYIILYFLVAFYFPIVAQRATVRNPDGGKDRTINWKYWLYICLYIAVSFLISLDFYT